MTYKEIYEIAVPSAKRKEEKLNLWVTFAVRPLSVLLTVPFVKKKVQPTSVTIVSLIMSIIGFFLVAFGNSMPLKIIGWIFFFAWAILDGVDGNLARCTDQCSALGDLWDTVGGYAAMVLIYFSAGISAFFDNNTYAFCDDYWFLIIGGAAALFSIFPRLVMHKKKSSGVNSDAVRAISDKTTFGLTNIIAMNFVSPSGFMQVIFLLCILFHTLNIFIVFYFLVNFGIMILSLRKLLRE